MKKFLTSVLLTAGLVVGVAAPAFAHHGTLDADVTCSLKGYEIIWSLLNSETDKEAEVIAASVNVGSLDGIVVGAGMGRNAIHSGNVDSPSILGRTSVPRTTVGAVTLSVTVRWQNQVEWSGSHSITPSDLPCNIKGDTGAKGDKGDKGDTGLKGDKGDTGSQGDPGAKGDQGDTGDQGIQGEPGNDGSNGADGNDGVDGADGSDGSDGATGPAGPTGSSGATGAVGARGDSGPAGSTTVVQVESVPEQPFKMCGAAKVGLDTPCPAPTQLPRTGGNTTALVFGALALLFLGGAAKLFSMNRSA